jgi:2-isopropylmalate synthase
MFTIENFLSSVQGEPEQRELRNRLERLQDEGYDLEAADGTREMVLRDTLRPGLRPFEVVGFEVSTRRIGAAECRTTATVTLAFRCELLTFTADGIGPLHALDEALRRCLACLYPFLSAVILTDYRVRVLDQNRGTASRVLVLIGWTDGTLKWTTGGVSENLIEASWIALSDSVRLELLRQMEQDHNLASLMEDASWAV